jgi:hypothetical protein
MEAGTVQRAFQLAPECSTIDEIRAKLKREGHSNIEAHLQGASIRKDLAKLLKGR